MGLYCYSLEKKDPLNEKMNQIKNNIEKKNLIGTGGSSKVKYKLMRLNNFNL